LRKVGAEIQAANYAAERRGVDGKTGAWFVRYAGMNPLAAGNGRGSVGGGNDFSPSTKGYAATIQKAPGI